VNATAKALFLDRDGTIILDKHYLHDPEEVELIDGASDALRMAQEEGFLLFLFTNQSGIGRGMFGIEDAEACNRRTVDLLGLSENLFTETCIAPERPDQESKYRKPSPAFILEMIQQHDLDPEKCWMVGDRDADLEAGIRAGINTAYVRTGKPENEVVREYIKEDKAVENGDLLQFVKAHLLSK